MSSPMVRAILEGRKTQTRRIIKPTWSRCLDLTQDDEREQARIGCPYGVPGNHLWVREAFVYRHKHDRYYYRADHPKYDPYAHNGWKPSIHMPRWASRITLEVTGVRVERLQDISEEDTRAEGIRELPLQEGAPGAWFGDPAGKHDRTARAAFERLWASINGAESWNANPFVWVVEFKRVEAQREVA